MSILNLTMHVATTAQSEEGVVEPSNKQAVKDLLLFRGMPSAQEVHERAEALADLAVQAEVEAAMIGGAHYLMAPLHTALAQRGILPLYAFAERRSVEEEVNGEVTKKNIFVHLGCVG